MAGRTAVRNKGEWRPAATSPVARVAVDVPLAHLDRPFDYAVPEHLDAAAGIGVRVRVRFAGRLVDGFVLERVAASEHAGRLAWLEKVVSTEQALPPEIAELCRAVADRYGGVLADVLRLALPPRHARVEAEATRAQAAAAAGGTQVAEASSATTAAAAATVAAAAGGTQIVDASSGPAAAAAATSATAAGGTQVADASSAAPAAAEPGIAAATVARGAAAGTAFAGARAGDVTDTAGAGSDPAADRRRPAGSGGVAVDGGRVGWGRYPRGEAFLRALGEGRAAHAVWQALAG